MENTNFLNSKIFFPTDWQDYELIDFGNNKKLERFGIPKAVYLCLFSCGLTESQGGFNG